MQRKSTRTKEHSSKSIKKREPHKPEKLEKEDQKYHKKNNEEDKENNYKKNDTTNKREDDRQNKKTTKNINLNDDDIKNKKRSWFDTFVESIDSEVDLRCKKMASEAAVLASRLTKAERVWTMQLPKCVREMNVKEFVEKYNANVNLVMQASTIGPREKPVLISAPNERPIANQREIEGEKSVDTTEKQMEKLEKEATQSQQIPLTAATPPPTAFSKEAIPQIEVQSFLQQYFSNPNLTVEERKNQVNFIVKQMQCLERILVRQGKNGNKN